MKFKGFLVAALVLVVIGVSLVWFFVYNKSHLNYATEDAAFVGTTDSLYTIIETDQEAFRKKYINTAIVVEGSVLETNKFNVILNLGFHCHLDSSVINTLPQVNSEVSVKGRVVGITEDILTGDLICNLDQCVILED